MIAFVTTIGEPTTDLCIWSLKRNGFEVHTVSGSDSLACKLKRIYEEASNLDVDFVRVDADVVPNRNLVPDIKVDQDIWWAQFQCFDWYRQDIMNGGIQFIRREALPHLLTHINEAMHLERPETYVYRLEEFGNPRRCITVEGIKGIHGFSNDSSKAKAVKQRRNQIDGYDFELAERLNAANS